MFVLKFKIRIIIDISNILFTIWIDCS